ncbi:HAD family phosphatase [Maribacter polysiphoniae]|uniref:HAD family phosphatase n=1 Tax=Maribacter polysiphoniae TaxID=429344 RepID=A0A316E092_9FLAO|nr:HAD family phosphatase [Maribacter polysiphoniae]MBD1261223.1 HAD family phosphatase [Maribacter polysiphoniae]PWK23535.1 putative hydrolase of the HAD superfamily [Maribacter polysiphoniae]
MIKNIIFDFGDVFINLDKEIIFREIQKYDNANLTPDLLDLSNDFEVGAITSGDFVKKLQIAFPSASSQEIVAIWNGMILDFPEYRLEFIEKLAQEKTHRLFLLSNTNALHISKVIETMGEHKYHRFKNCFEQFYLSHEIEMRKPNKDIYGFVLKENGLNAPETLFIDDTPENTLAAEQLGIKTWNIIVGKEDVIQLNSRI